MNIASRFFCLTKLNLPRGLCACVILAALLSGVAARAVDLFVDNLTGDDRWNGRANDHGDAGDNPIGPARTIRRALSLAQMGDRIILAKNEEPYRESISLVGSRHSGSVLRPFVIEGNGATLDGSSASKEGDWEHVSGELFRLRLKRLHYQQLFLDGRPAVRQSLGDAPKNLATLRPLEWQLADGFLYFRTELTTLPQDYKPSYANHPTGITLYHVSDVIVRNISLQGFQIDGLQAHDAGIDRPIVLAGVTARGNGRAGIALNGAARVAIDGCLVGNNGQAQIVATGPAEGWITNCTILDNTAPKFLVRGGRLTIDGQPLQEAAVPPALLPVEPADRESP